MAKPTSSTLPAKIDETTYYKLKLLSTETQLMKLQAEQALSSAIERQKAAFIEAGLNPFTPFKFDDATHGLIPVEGKD